MVAKVRAEADKWRDMPLVDNQSSNLGGILIRLLEERLQHSFPNGERGKTLLTIADFSGTHSGSPFAVYAFLSLDLDQNQRWFEGQRHLRSSSLRKRRMSFKRLNDVVKQQALVPFLDLADTIQGAFTVVVVPRDFGQISEIASPASKSLLDLWKPKIHEHLMRVTHLGGIVTAVMSRPNQDLYFMIDEDDAASNVKQLTRLTEIVARVLSNCLHHDLRHIRVGTTKSDDGSLSIEDLAAISDLAAGSTWELMKSLNSNKIHPVKGIVTSFPRMISRKAQVIGHWLAHDEGTLRKSILLYTSEKGQNGGSISSLSFEPIISSRFAPTTKAPQPLPLDAP